MDFTVENLCGLLIRSRLMPADAVKSVYQDWLDDAKDKATSSSHFTRWLVSHHHVTDYQASLLSKGMADDFFLGDYKILERAGRGRMAGVYKAVHPSGQLVAIKVLPPSRAKIPILLARFQREARLSLKFNHFHVVRSLHVGDANGLNFLVMELLDGETVDDVLHRRKRLPPTEAVQIVHQTLLGLQHIHELGVVHRDLKPSNLMLVPGVKPGESDTTLGRTVKILDIGLARALFEEPGPGDKIEASEVTQEGVLLGTPDYLSPEQARDPRAIDIRSDIYSLGCVLHHLLTGQPPFPDGNILNQMLRHATEMPTPLREFNPTIPDGLQQILNFMTAKKADQRYATPVRAAAALQTFLVADGGGETTRLYPSLPASAALEALTVSPPTPKKSNAAIPTARALKKTGKFAAVAKSAPQGKPHAPPPLRLNIEVELVPFDLAPPTPTPFATQEPTGNLIAAAKPKHGGNSVLMLTLGVGVVVLVIAIAIVAFLILKP